MDHTAATGRHLPRAGFWLVAGLLLFVQLLRVPYAATHLDFARDLFVAWRLLQGEEWPLAGPVLAGTIHLGPTWYWLLAALLALTRSWLGVVFALGLLSALQLLLAWRLGRTLHGERAGLLWAALLLLPSWSSIEWMLPQHYVLTAPLVLAFLACTARLLTGGSGVALAGMALSLVLAVHAHPSSIGLVWLGMGAAGHALWQRRIGLRDGLLAAAAALLPLLPYLAWSIGNDFADFRAGSAYLGDARSTGSVAMALPLLYEATLGGLDYWLQQVLAWPAWAVWSVRLVLLGLVAAAAAGLLQLARDPQRRALCWTGLATLLALALTTALIRHATTYYMTTPLRVVALGLLALGLAELRWAAFAPWLRRAALAAALGLGLLGAASAARFLAAGNWPFDFQALFGVTGPRAATAPLPLLPAYAMGASGAFLCDQPASAAHGAYARHLLYDYAMEMRLACARSDVQAGGADPARRHWLGLGRAQAREAGLVPASRLGAIALFPVHRVLAGDAVAMPDVPRYPVHLPRENAPQPRSLMLQLAPGERLAVATLAFFIPSPQLEWRGGTRPLRLLASDAVTQVYACDGCAADETLSGELVVTTPYAADTDIVVF